MEYDVRPDPTPEELEVLVLALSEDGAAGPSAYRSAWREAGLGEAGLVEPEEE